VKSCTHRIEARIEHSEHLKQHKIEVNHWCTASVNSLLFLHSNICSDGLINVEQRTVIGSDNDNDDN